MDENASGSRGQCWAQPAGPQFRRIGFLETIEAAKNSEHYQSPLPKPNGKPRGRGVKMFRAILILGRDQVYAVEDDRIGSQCSRFVQYRQRLIKMALLEFQLDKFQKR